MVLVLIIYAVMITNSQTEVQFQSYGMQSKKSGNLILFPFLFGKSPSQNKN